MSYFKIFMVSVSAETEMSQDHQGLPAKATREDEWQAHRAGKVCNER